MQTNVSPPSNPREAVPRPPGPAKNVCPDCGRAAKDGEPFCASCGHGPLPATAGDRRPFAGPASAPPTANQPVAGENAKARPIAKQECKETGVPASSPAPAASPAMTCLCGAHLLDGAKFCHACGLRVGPPSPAFRLVCKGRANGRRVVELDKDVMTIGSAGDCDVVVPGDAYASRHHAQISRVDGRFQLEDLDSSNGSFLRIRRPIALEVGDEIMVGTTAVRLEEVP